MSEPDLYRELFVWLAHRPDVLAVRFSDGEIDLRPQTQTYESGRPTPALVTVAISRNEFAAAWSGLLAGAIAVGLDTGRDLPEVAAFALLDVHLDEGVNSLREPGPRGYHYESGEFRPF